MYTLCKYLGESNMETARLNPVRNSDVYPLCNSRTTGHFQVDDSVQRTQTVPPPPAFFAGKKGSLWSSKNRTLAW